MPSVNSPDAQRICTNAYKWPQDYNLSFLLAYMTDPNYKSSLYHLSSTKHTPQNTIHHLHDYITYIHIYTHTTTQKPNTKEVSIVNSSSCLLSFLSSRRLDRFELLGLGRSRLLSPPAPRGCHRRWKGSSRSSCILDFAHCLGPRPLPLVLLGLGSIRPSRLGGGGGCHRGGFLSLPCLRQLVWGLDLDQLAFCNRVLQLKA